MDPAGGHHNDSPVRGRVVFRGAGDHHGGGGGRGLLGGVSAVTSSLSPPPVGCGVSARLTHSIMP